VLFQRIANAANGIGFFILLLGFAFALLIARAREWMSARLWSVLALGLIFVDLFSLGAYVDVGTSDPTLSYQRPDVVDFLRSNTGLARIDSRTDVEGLWRPDTGLLYRLQDVYGDNPLVLKNFSDFWEAAGSRDSSNYQLLNVKYVLTRRGTPMPPNFVNAFEGGGGITVWENKTAAPRAWVDTNASATGNELTIGPPPTGGEEVTFTAYGPNEMLAQVNATAEGHVVLSEVYAPGWSAFVDGQAAPILRANQLLRAVPITAGGHELRVVYDPVSFKLGAILSGVTLVLLIGAIVWLWRKEE
jgi:hypothetical protein